MNLVDEQDSKMPKVAANIAFSFLNTLHYRLDEGPTNVTSVICADHSHELLRPLLTSTWMPNAIGSLTGRSAIFAENQVRLCINIIHNLTPRHPSHFLYVNDTFAD